MEAGICPFCEWRPAPVDPVNGQLLCEHCAEFLGDRADLADKINRSDW